MSARREVAIGLLAYAAYLAVRAAVWTELGRARADRNAQRLIALERRLGVLIEPTLQAAALRTRRLVAAANAGYAAGNVALSVGWLISLHARHDPGFRRERRAAVAAFLGAMPVFLLLPTAPPRTQQGFVDTLADQGLDLDHPRLVRIYNPIAAMPSHHVAFAVVTAAGLAHRARSPFVRAAAWSYAPVVAVVVIATGNHYLADVFAGAGLGVLARWSTR
jgi:hypothetical protein